jgi:hypothetical protein
MNLSGLVTGGGKKERLTIQGFKMIDLTGPVDNDPIELQVNPQEISFSYSLEPKDGGDKSQATGQPAPNPIGTWDYSAGTLKIDTIVDITGVILDPKVEFEKGEGVIKYIEKLKKHIYYFDQESHGPPYVKIVWGSIMPTFVREGEKPVFKGRLKELEVKYTMFSLSGKPLRAELSMTFEWVEPPSKRPPGNSPDLTHFVEVKHGDNLPALCKKIYDSPDFFMQIARINNLPSVYALKPGMKLLFPPLEKASR